MRALKLIPVIPSSPAVIVTTQAREGIETSQADADKRAEEL